MFSLNKIKPRTRLLLAVAATAFAYAPVCVHAEPPESPVTVKVSYADLNLSTPDGARRLYSRIENAAYAACGTSRSDTESLMNAPGSCVKQAIGQAVQSARIPSLAQVYIRHNSVETAKEFGITTDVMTAQR
jgi:UrcA family protein